MSIRFFHWNDLQVYVDPSPQVLRLEMDQTASLQEMRLLPLRTRTDTGGFRTFEYDIQQQFQAPLFPSVSSLPVEDPFVSAAVLAQKAKSVDDSIVATLELLLDDGTMSVMGRSALIQGLLVRLRDGWDRSPGDEAQAEAIGLLMAARALAGTEDSKITTNPPPELRLHRSRWLSEFRKRQEVDVPLGVYSWSTRLAGLYRQAKALQEGLSENVASTMAAVLEADETMCSAYETHIALAIITNPLVGSSVLSRSGERPSLFPPSDSFEGRLLKRLVGPNRVPPGFNLIGELIARISDGRLSLAITGASGWYDHVLYSLEPLLLPDQAPEAAKLELAESYREDLRQLFESLLGSARESHVKQLEALSAGGCPLVIAPCLTVEPLAEYYRRRAESYCFVRERLVATLGEDVLFSRKIVTSTGQTDRSLLEEMLLIEQLFTGAAAVVDDELGIGCDLKPEDKRRFATARATTRSWIVRYRDDPDLSEDVRLMVPLFKDIERNEFHVLATLGYEQRTLKASFVECPTVAVRDRLGRPVHPEIVWDDAKYPLARPVTIRCRVKTLLDREQFRALCDSEKTVSAIRAALEGQ